MPPNNIAEAFHRISVTIISRTSIFPDMRMPRLRTIWVSERPRLIVPHWSAKVLDEVRRTHSNKLGWPPYLVDSYQQTIRQAFPQAGITGYESLIHTLCNDPKDRHVVAAAISGQCPLILTFNLKHFSAEALAPWSMQASHPRDYLLVLYEVEPQQIIDCQGEIAGRRKLEIEHVLIRLGRVLPKFSGRVLDDLGA